MQVENNNVVDAREKNVKVAKDKPSNRSPCGFMAKLKSIKHIEVIIAIAVIAVMVLCYGLMSKDKGKEVSTVSESDKLAIEIEKILKNIKGVGDVSVLIVFNGGEKIEVASKVDKETNTITDDGRVTVVENETRTPIMVNGKPFVLSEKRADIDGVVVVATGGGDMSTRIQISKAISTLLKIEYNKIQVFEKK